MAKGEDKKPGKAEVATKAKRQTTKAIDKSTKKSVKKADDKVKDKKKVVKKTTEKSASSDTGKGSKKKTEKKETTKTSKRTTKAVKTEPAPSPFSKIGQKHVTPPKGDGTRGFYESLYEAHPNSVLAIVYCVEHGLFGGQKHQELYERYQEMRKQGFLKGGSGGVRAAAVQFLQKLDKKASKKLVKQEHENKIAEAA
ncbi:uncharacterized protein BXIN_2531 [Babesia sp. Xinjiang]|uniref:uncharacterized protein n=1 Tax=Babesia sp. Xinjiang TaxID=462227 RepID=UPI000A243653|nr:uncharacterized protein BXIN_2531 [Babesia sp. Xinjiang]ORM41395.1 hypothetical protein BXIN_2531 [Babesia sp. Xinjiang]